ncbi:FadR/GntR family transcriptional regulator [Brevibacterium yomogidense]|uniref:FadR/GntR family transcriptional regulator n=1 Tax=Brevibacterium yomogidense TaxID=946573 RepID=UPI0018DFB2F7|nr:FCD domain-containing protein [Brevibacterium yomogidense]
METSDHRSDGGKPRRRYTPIAQDLLRYIDRTPGAGPVRLPPDRDLAEKYGVSRATVREALFALDLIGAVEVKHGEGTYVVNRSARLQESDQFQYGATPEHVIDTRIIIEPSISEQLARHPAQIEDAVRAYEIGQDLIPSQTRVAEFTQQALQFHLSLAAALDNKLLGELAFEVVSIDTQPLWALINQLALQSPSHREKLQEEHLSILEAIQSRDEERAFRAMEGHLKNNKTRIIPGQQ